MNEITALALTAGMPPILTMKYFWTNVLFIPRRLKVTRVTEARGSVPGQVHVRFVVDKVALGQVFLRVVRFPLSVSIHWCSITCKTW
jgi:hypothetical protein